MSLLLARSGLEPNGRQRDLADITDWRVRIQSTKYVCDQRGNECRAESPQNWDDMSLPEQIWGR
jgi:hypothetical protein